MNKSVFYLFVFLVLIASALGYSLEYDGSGNLISDETHYYVYDGFDNLIAIHSGNSTSDPLLEEYVYDDQSNRLMKIAYDGEGGNVTSYYFDDFVQIVNSSGTYNITYFYHDSILVGKKVNNDLFAIESDRLGSSSVITDENGEIVSSTEYDAYGYAADGEVSERLYTGKELDSSGLYYYGARYYDSYTTRFTQPDPVIKDMYNSQNLNRYAYVLNNPYKYTDPDGRYAESLIDIGFIIYDIGTIINDPRDANNWAALGADVAGLALPAITGLGAGVRAAKAADKAIDGARALDNVDSVTDLGRAGDNALDLTKSSDVKTDFYGTPNGQVVPSKTPGGRDITPHAADRMANPPYSNRDIMTPSEVDNVLDIGVFKKDNPVSGTTTYWKPDSAGRPQVAVDSKTESRVITTIKNKK